MEQKMSKKPRRKHLPAFKTKVSLAGDKILAPLPQEFEIHQNQIVDWKQQLTERAAEVLGSPRSLNHRLPTCKPCMRKSTN